MIIEYLKKEFKNCRTFNLTTENNIDCVFIDTIEALGKVAIGGSNETKVGKIYKITIIGGV